MMTTTMTTMTLMTNHDAVIEMRSICTAMRHHLESLTVLKAEIEGSANKLGAFGEWHYMFHDVKTGMEIVLALDNDIIKMSEQIVDARKKAKEDPTLLLIQARDIAAKHIIR